MNLPMPYAVPRLLATLLACMGAMVATRADVLLAGWLCAIIPLLILTSTMRPHLKFIVVALAPIAAMLFIVWPVLIAAPPGEPIGSNPTGAFAFAAVTSLRLAFIAGAAQLCILTIPPDQLAVTLRRWGLRGEWLVIALGTMALGPEFAIRRDQVITARVCRGLVRQSSLMTRLIQLPSLLIPLFSWSLRSAIHRADVWTERKLLERVSLLARAPEHGSVWTSGTIMLAAAGWALINLWLRVRA